MNMDLDSAFRVFVRVAETESFSLTAKQLGMGQPAVSKQLSALEEHLGSRLLHRSTRSITLTDEGRELLGHARHAVAATDFALERVQRVKGKASGLMRLSCQTGFGRMAVVPRLTAILENFPDLDIELLLQDSWPNLVEQGIDLRIHVGEVEDETVIAQLIGHKPVWLFASRAYVEKHGTPQTPEDLASHQFVRFSGASGKRRLSFSKDGRNHSLDLKPRISINNLDALCEAVGAGVGISSGPVWWFENSPDQTSLVRLLPDYDMGEVPLYAVYPSRRFVPQKVRIFIDYLKDEFRKYEMEHQLCNMC
jgi:DNA-binding transcriptional LysR family regulator